MDKAVAHLLDFSKEFDITLLDQIVDIAYNSNHPQRSAANEFLVQIKDHPDMWKRADAILEKSTRETTRYFGLQVLNEAISTRWKILPVEQREGIRNYVVSKILMISSKPDVLRANNTFIARLNLVLVNILKHDWPHNWPTFISDLVGSSKNSESLCENNMQILQLLSEEVFDYSMESMTALKAKQLKESLNEEFAQVFQLCQFILEAPASQSLLSATLKTLERFLSWIPLGYIFETQLPLVLINKFFPVPVFRNGALDCLIEIASLPPGDIPLEYTPAIQVMLINFLQQAKVIVPSNLVEAFEQGSEDDCLFVAKLAIFLSSFLRSHQKLFEKAGNPELENATLEALTLLVMVSEVKDDEIFKSCLDFWHHFVKELFSSDGRNRNINAIGSLLDGCGTGYGGSYLGSVSYTGIYSSVLHRLRHVIIDKMAKPEEVLIVEDENGEIVREMTKDTEVIAQYKTMREAIIYLTHLNYDDTESIMLGKLELQVVGGKFTWQGLNTLCWAIGSISGAMSETDEKRFLVTVIKDLLRLCEEQRGKDNKAVVASNIMYIVGQYPRFLRAHWKFLKTVVNKLFEFMHELHPGVQDMACDTFLKIAQKCKRKFMTIQIEETKPFIMTLISDLYIHVNDLQPHQVQSFYESVACMVSDQVQPVTVRKQIVLSLMELPNSSWNSIIEEGKVSLPRMFVLDIAKEITRILKINTKVCLAAGSIYIHQLSNIFLDMLNIYSLYSGQIIEACKTQGEIAARYTNVKVLRGAKTEILELMIAFFEVSHDLENSIQVLMGTFIPPLFEAVLRDYCTTFPAARDSKVLFMLSKVISVLKQNISAEIPRIMEAVIQPTLEMITKNMTDYPDHRMGFFSLLREANAHCFYALFSIAPHLQKLVIDSIVWAFKHTERNISETGLEILQELLQNISNTPQVAQAFYQSFFLVLLQDILGVMTDRLHKSGFKLQATTLRHMFHLLNTNSVLIPLVDPNTQASAQLPDGTIDNVTFVKEYVANLLLHAFPNLTRTQIINFIKGLFVESIDLLQFKQHLRDFLITVKEFQSEDNTDLFYEEQEALRLQTANEQRKYQQSIPGLLAPSELPLYDEDD